MTCVCRGRDLVTLRAVVTLRRLNWLRYTWLGNLLDRALYTRCLIDSRAFRRVGRSDGGILVLICSRNNQGVGTLRRMYQSREAS